MVTEKQKAWLSACLIIIIGSVIYANSLDVPFLFDDADNIQNPNLRIENLDYGEFQNALAGGTLKSRPVSNFSFALNYYLGGYKVQGYHLVNIFIHICAAIILFHLVRLTLSFSPNCAYRYKDNVSLFTALLWLTHPLATQSVTYVVQRMNSMAAMFYLLALLLYVLGRREHLAPAGRACNKLTMLWYFLACGISGALAMGSKEIAATLPIVIFLYEWFFIQDLSFAWLKKRAFWVLGVFGLILVVLYIYTDGNILQRTLFSGSRRDFTTWERVLTQFRVVVHYIGLIAFPHPSRLVFDYNIPFSTSFFTPLSTFYSFLFLSALFLLGLSLAVKERLLSFCILWFFITLAIESSIIGLELVFEHRTYMPSMFLLLVIPALLFRWKSIPRTGTAIVMVGVVLLFSLWTVQRNVIWQDEVTFWRDSVTKSPEKPRTNNNLGVALARAERVDDAAKYFLKAIILKKNFPEPYNNMGLVREKQGKLKEAESYYLQSLKLRPHFERAHINLASLYEHEGRYDLALKHFEYLYKKYPESALLNFHVGKMLLRLGKVADSLPFLEMAHSREPRDTTLQLSRGEAYQKTGRIYKAIEAYLKALEFNADNITANYNLGLLYSMEGEEDKALFHYKKVAALQSLNVPVQYNLGNVHLRLSQLEEAKRSYLELLQLSGTLSNTYNNLGLIYIRRGEFRQAAEQFKYALSINPEHSLAESNLKKVLEKFKTGNTE